MGAKVFHISLKYFGDIYVLGQVTCRTVMDVKILQHLV